MRDVYFKIADRIFPQFDPIFLIMFCAGRYDGYPVKFRSPPFAAIGGNEELMILI